VTELSFDTLHAFDGEPYARGDVTRFLCPLCGAEKPRDNAHRCLTVRVDGVWHCMRCDERGVLTEFKKRGRASAITRARRTRLGIFD
jgi:hypothetical protein